MRTSQKTPETISTISIDVGKNILGVVVLSHSSAYCVGGNCSLPDHSISQILPRRGPQRYPLCEPSQ
jgi:hypothetical protein